MNLVPNLTPTFRPQSQFLNFDLSLACCHLIQVLNHHFPLQMAAKEPVTSNLSELTFLNWQILVTSYVLLLHLHIPILVIEAVTQLLVTISTSA